MILSISDINEINEFINSVKKLFNYQYISKPNIINNIISHLDFAEKFIKFEIFSKNYNCDDFAKQLIEKIKQRDYIINLGTQKEIDDIKLITNLASEIHILKIAYVDQLATK